MNYFRFLPDENIGYDLRDKMSIGQIVEALGAIWLTSEPDQYVDQITYIRPLAR